MSFSEALQEPLEVLPESISPQDFYEPRYIQLSVGLLCIQEHLKQWLMAYSCQILCQFGLQRFCARPPFLPEPVQCVMELYGSPEAVVYDSGYHLPDNLHQLNDPAFPIPFQ